MSVPAFVILLVVLELLGGSVLLLSVPAVANTIIVEGPDLRELVLIVLRTAVVMAVGAWLWTDALCLSGVLRPTVGGCSVLPRKWHIG